jgi:hypothetical protein
MWPVVGIDSSFILSRIQSGVARTIPCSPRLLVLEKVAFPTRPENAKGYGQECGIFSGTRACPRTNRLRLINTEWSGSTPSGYQRRLPLC